MKKFLPLLLLAIMPASLISAQDVHVTGVTTSQKKVEKSGKAISPSLFEVVYKYDVNAIDKEGELIEENHNGMLQIGDGMAKFYDYGSFRLDSINAVPGVHPDSVRKLQSEVYRQVFLIDDAVFMDYPTGEMTVDGCVFPDFFKYQEPMNAIDWQITEETDNVCGYPCVKATGEYGGRTWNVWFAEEIPSPYGPWKLNGLPGLILAAKDSDGIHNFSAIVFRKGTTDIMADENARTKITREEYIKAKQEFEALEVPLAGIDPNSIREVTVWKTADGEGKISINGIPLRQRAYPYVPLETK